ncbi:uncharacterized protein N7484_006513 [Penicillium longicatenatum]|uniref:uncharacterized protein n=1 Tax=Penicillium longicatenatum TaxID=1561947 RepID=UPI0025498FA9|nr:uncharacterized protein N7484_006513 [Penicillium longicatenatum]KAJ5644006.1 hypothetical protein N7484_006513 [Penicillium longicatenatum]
MSSPEKKPAKLAKASRLNMKWDEHDNAILLTKLIETHSIKVDAQLISDAWPQESGSPSARAIREQIARIKSMKAKTKASVVPDHTSAGDTDSALPVITKHPCKRSLGTSESKPSKKPARMTKSKASVFLHEDLQNSLLEDSTPRNDLSSDADRSAREDPDNESDLA